jgi:E1A/CREB-binding protein
MLKVPLAPFKGNRFNIVFHNGAGVHFLQPCLKEFFSEVKDENLLMKAVNADLNVEQYLAGARALGVIDKVLTTPLWRVIERTGHVSGLNERYERLCECLERWAKDATSVLHGEEVLFDDVQMKKDDVYESLINVDVMTVQVLEKLFAAFVCKLRALVSDHMVGGVNTGMDDVRLKETESVPCTNVDCERDFGMLDRMMREKPRAYTCAYEGVMMFSKNGTSQWLQGMNETDVQEVCEKARKSVDDQMVVFKRRMAVIGAERASKLEQKKSDRERKEVKE